MKEETAVEFLFRMLYNKDTMNDYLIRVFEQAKEIENKKLKEMYLKGIENYNPPFENENYEH